MSVNLMQGVTFLPPAQRQVNEPARNVRNLSVDVSHLPRRVWNAATLAFSYLTRAFSPNSLEILLNALPNNQNMVHRISTVARQIWDRVVNPPLSFSIRMLSLETLFALNRDPERNLIALMPDDYNDNAMDLFTDILNNNSFSAEGMRALVVFLLSQESNHISVSNALQQLLHLCSNTGIQSNNDLTPLRYSYMNLLDDMIHFILLDPNFCSNSEEQERQLANFLTITLPVLEAINFELPQFGEPIISIWTRALEKAMHNNGRI